MEDGFGKSAPTSARKVGAFALPLDGPAKIVLADCVLSDPVSVPDVEIGLPLTENMEGNAKLTDVTVPVVDKMQVHDDPPHVKTPPVTGQLW